MAAFYHRLAKYRVPISLVFGIFYLFISRLAIPYLSLALPFIIMGEALRLWASGYLRKGVKLTTSGPYGFLRHPLYLGNLLLGLGFILLAWHYLLLILFIALFIPLYFSTIKTEEEIMIKLFDQQYRHYQKNVHLLFPRFLPFKGEREKFKWSLVRKNREYRSLLGIGVVIAIQFLKAYFLK